MKRSLALAGLLYVTTSRPRLLLIDDDPGVLVMLSALLEERFEVTVRQDALAIVEDFKSLEPALVLLDVAMPEVDGLTAARRLKSRHPEARIVFLSGDTSSATVKAAEKAGGCGFVMKTLAAPFLIPALEAALS